jgi:hypothetical protein
MRAEPTERSEPGPRLHARLVAVTTLVTFVSAVAFLGHEAYRAFTDSFIAPVILSPDNELVLQAKLRAADLYAERTKALAQQAALAGQILANEKAVERLRSLLPLAAEGVAETLERERAVLAQMEREQQALVDQASRNLEARLITEAEYARDAQVLAQVRVALLENARVRAESRLSREERVTRVELELTRLEAELQAERAEQELIGEKLAMIDEFEAQLRARPIFQAMDRRLDVAFVPYTQIEGVSAGEPVYDCLWGLLFCEPVGRVDRLVPGEVAMTDPWGNPARGQYAVLELGSREAARAKSLRVRPSSEATATADVAAR